MQKRDTITKYAWYEEDIVKEHLCKKHFAKFYSGHFSI
jgi:hypothetical protein